MVKYRKKKLLILLYWHWPDAAAGQMQKGKQEK